MCFPSDTSTATKPGVPYAHRANLFVGVRHLEVGYLGDKVPPQLVKYGPVPHEELDEEIAGADVAVDQPGAP